MAVSCIPPSSFCCAGFRGEFGPPPGSSHSSTFEALSDCFCASFLRARALCIRRAETAAKNTSKYRSSAGSAVMVMEGAGKGAGIGTSLCAGMGTRVRDGRHAPVLQGVSEYCNSARACAHTHS
jgi:hypothetical protein